ncbi:MAG: TonB-dependent receptor [Saprospiraceae bacterium]|nr:TonB-dependent receptor [Saprospiraceae bacterium]
MRTLFMGIGIFLLWMTSPAQQAGRVAGRVLHPDGQGLFGATIIYSGSQKKHTFSDNNGAFSFDLLTIQPNDSLEIRFVGLKTQKVALEAPTDALLILMESSEAQNISAVSVIAKKAIAEEFSVEQVGRMDVYFNPLAKGDPLNAIQLLAASTDTEESASPSLRGSAPNRSIVVVDGVPVRNPVRYTQLNGVGSFSILNTEMLESQYVYASNPPLAYGNSSAGLIDIQLRETDVRDAFTVGAGLAQAGASFTKTTKDNNGYFTAYSNVNFPQLYRTVNEAATDQLNDFGSVDLGLRYFRKWDDYKKLSVFNYSNTENYDFSFSLFSHNGSAIAKQKRNFSVAKYQWGNEVNTWSINTGADITKADFAYGNLISNTQREETFAGLNFRRNNRYYVFQTGLSHRWSSDDFEEQLPQYYFAMADDKPSFRTDSLLQQHDIQGFAYGKFYLGNFTFSGGIRTNIPAQTDQEQFVSYQSATKYAFDNRHNVLLSAGKYHNYNYPTGQARNLDLLSSDQISLEYNYLSAKTEVKLAGFYKEETNNRPVTDRYVEDVDGNQYIQGVELSLKQDIGKRFTLDVANTFLDVEVENEGQRVAARNDLGHLVKAGLTYFNNDVFSFGASYVARPGTRYTDITEGYYISEVDAFAPVFQSQLNGSRYGRYENISLTANRAFELKNDRYLVLYSVLNNLLARENESNAVFNEDYSEKSFEFYGRRWAYIGAQIEF